ncbi:hypothetical protein [Plantactinospora soyae]|uniref:Uncharacterized protein n=1 Tax=Plantactinospora soyae TaxID=1544732 RepID=A0A927QYP3_9ACTN|nr:hypothetical protein [Plantactinospora soyae]MBE1486763.1 hypothetical protein [Plantactinospora soyae]
MDRIDEVLGEVPLPPYVTAEDVDFAVRAIAVHAPEQGPDGLRCRNDQAAHPCRLHRWGQRVLAERGLSEAQVRASVTHHEASAVRP